MSLSLRLLVLALLVIGVGFWSGQQSAAPAQEKKDMPAAVTKWEYKVVAETPNEREMNKLGADGWELVGFTLDPAPAFRYQVFKRPKR